MKNDLANELKETKSALLGAIDWFSNANINAVPFEGSWTAGQVAEHVLMSASGVAKALRGRTATADRNPEQHIELFSEIFLNFEHKLKSPDFIIPSDEAKDKQALINALNETFCSIEDAAGLGDLDSICLAFEMPTLGTLSKKELIWFTIVHTKRHIHQLKNVADHLKGQETGQTAN
ncbi:MAG: DinB family protein [Bacteroidetes bacterium]|nr:DinB family protein [Bacteroidota bacterium]